MVKNIFSLILVCVFAFVAGFSLLHKGLPPTHDGEYHIVRFYQFDKALMEGNLYPRWASDFNKGFGIPLFNYVYPLPNYIASFFHLFGTSFIDAFKFQMFLSLVISAVFFYLWSREFWGNLGGAVSSIFYTFSPYHFVDIYIRGSVGEVWALAFAPALLWSLTKFINYKQQSFFFLSIASFALIIFSHNILALMFIPFVFIYAGFLIISRKRKKYLMFNTLCIVLLGLGLSAIFWLPALIEEKYTLGLKIFDFSSHFPQLYQLLIPSWGSGFSGANVQNQMSFQIGIANLLAVFISFSVVILTRHRRDKNLKIAILFLISFLLVFFLMTRQALFIWKNIPFMNYFQFPWRFLSLEIIIASFLAGSIVYFWKSKLLTMLLILLVFLLGIGYAKPAYYLDRNDEFYMNNPTFIDGTNSATNAFNTTWMNFKIAKQKEKIVFISGKGKVEQKVKRSNLYVFKADIENNSEILVNTAFFPGWTVKIDGEKANIARTRDGLFSFKISQGSHEIKIAFEDTNIRKVANIIFFLGLFAFGVLFARSFSATIKR